jgi:hypothetical protein
VQIPRFEQSVLTAHYTHTIDTHIGVGDVQAGEHPTQFPPEQTYPLKQSNAEMYCTQAEETQYGLGDVQAGEQEGFPDSHHINEQ